MKRSHLLHPGTILATVVVVAAVAGSVYGASTTGAATIGSAQIKNGSIKLADISPKARTALRGARGPAGAAGVGAAGAAGPAGPAGTARAYGFVSSAGVLDSARSKNLTVVKRSPAGELGQYCVTPTATSGVTRATAMPVVTPDFSDGSGTIHLAQFLSTPISGCDGWLVVTDNFTGGAFARTDIAFSIVIP